LSTKKRVARKTKEKGGKRRRDRLLSQHKTPALNSASRLEKGEGRETAADDPAKGPSEGREKVKAARGDFMPISRTKGTQGGKRDTARNQTGRGS